MAKAKSKSTWNRESTLTKIITAIFFLGVVPTWCFYLGMVVQEMRHAWNEADRRSSYVIIRHPARDKNAPKATTTQKSLNLQTEDDLSEPYILD